ncbi:MAG: DMT family transporter [Phycisphaerae bacterium]|nr:DMT family transporter [Phycisphaerae bacterium]
MVRSNTFKGAALIVGASAAYAGMSVLVKNVAAMGIDSYKITLFRFVIGLALLATAALFGKIKLVFNRGWLLFVRGLLGGGGVFLFFLTISHIGIAKGTVLSFTSTIFASLFSVLLLKERISLWKWLVVGAAMGGIYLVTTSKPDGDVSWTSFGLYELTGITTGVLSGLNKCIIKKLHATDTSYSIFFAQCAMGVWVVVVPANLVSCEIGISGGVLLLGIGALGSLGQLIGTEGYRHLPVSLGALLELSFPLFNLILGVLVFREAFSGMGLLGAGMILVSCAAMIRMTRRPAAEGTV